MNPRLRRWLIIATAIFLVLCISGTYVWFRRPPAGEKVEVVIERGATTRQIANMLISSDVIDSAFWFRVFVRVRRLDGRIQAGRYEMAKGIGPQAAIDILSNPPIERGTPIVIPPGFTLPQVAARIGAQTHITAQSFLDVATNGSIRPALLPEGKNNLEGFLYPETYIVGQRETAADIATKMVREFEARTRDLDWSIPERRGLSRYEALIIASLVEREARIERDRPKIAQVVYNRLKRGMRLQIDITALYGTDHRVPTLADLKRESPYNTYLIDGLPPTPIASPGLASIEAALHPTFTRAIYYVVTDRNGGHSFTDDPAEFERFKARRPDEVH